MAYVSNTLPGASVVRLWEGHPALRQSRRLAPKPLVVIITNPSPARADAD